MAQQNTELERRLLEELDATRGGMKALVIAVAVLVTMYGVGAALLLLE